MILPLYCCDLLSFFELLIFTTTPRVVGIMQYRLWFAFILWTTDIYNNFRSVCRYRLFVVICFHSLNYWYLQQQKNASWPPHRCCDLLSFFELLIFTTTRWVFHSICSPLWFAFILWTTDIYNNLKGSLWNAIVVVICFHSLNYWYLQQQTLVQKIINQVFSSEIRIKKIWVHWCSDFYSNGKKDF